MPKQTPAEMNRPQDYRDQYVTLPGNALLRKALYLLQIRTGESRTADVIERLIRESGRSDVLEDAQTILDLESKA